MWAEDALGSAATCSKMAMASPVRPADQYELAGAPGGEGAGVVWAEDALGVGGDPLLDGDGLAGAPANCTRRPGRPGR